MLCRGVYDKADELFDENKERLAKPGQGFG